MKWTFVRRFDSTDACFDHLETKGFKSNVTSPHVKGKTSIFLHEGDYTVHAKLAVRFGNEGMGISSRAVERSEMCVSVPMFGMIESLNLGHAQESCFTRSQDSGANIKAGTDGAIVEGSEPRLCRPYALQRLDRANVQNWIEPRRRSRYRAHTSTTTFAMATRNVRSAAERVTLGDRPKCARFAAGGSFKNSMPSDPRILGQSAREPLASAAVQERPRSRAPMVQIRCLSPTRAPRCESSGIQFTRFLSRFRSPASSGFF